MDKRQHSLLLKECLNEEEFEKVKELERTCQLKEEIDLKLELDFKQELGYNNKEVPSVKELLYYADEILIAYLGISEFGGRTIELSGMTHPDWRKRGIFTRLLNHALLEIKREEYNKILLISDEKSIPGNFFIKSSGGSYAFSEYHMRLEKFPDFTNEDNRVLLRKAELSDIKEIRRQDSIFWGDESINQEYEEDVLPDYLDSQKESTYMIQAEGNTIGKIRVEYSENSALIYGFGILPQYRKKGYGKAALKSALRFLNEQGTTCVELDVESRNNPALNLYRLMGFKEVTVMNYYSLRSIERRTS